MSYQQPQHTNPNALYQPKPEEPGFFDVKFTRFLSLSLISVWYVVALVVIVIGALVGIVSGFVMITRDDSSPFVGVGLILGSLVGAVLLAVLTRLALEGIAVLFRIANNTSAMAEALRRRG